MRHTSRRHAHWMAWATLSLAAALLLLGLNTRATAQDATPTDDPVLASTPFPTQGPRPLPALRVEGPGTGLALELYAARLPQGGALLLRASGDGLASARLRFLDREADFFAAQPPAPPPGDTSPTATATATPTPSDPDPGGLYQFLVAGLDQAARAYDLSVLLVRDDGQRETVNTTVEVVPGGFIRQDFALPEDRTYLADAELERLELARLDSVLSVITPEAYWGGQALAAPMSSPFTSPFGAFRTINGTLSTRHTGWDLRAAVGTPVFSSADGRVAFAGPLDIRGGYVLVDHGWGVFSGYAHLAQLHVTRGQHVRQGQVLGTSGNTGRSSGPHLHWEVAVRGVWVDGVAFAGAWLP